MNKVQEAESQSVPAPENQGITINDMKYSYLITKSENKEDSLFIKLFDPNEKSNMYFTYDAPMEQLTKDVKFLSLYETLDEIIDNLNDIFSQGNAHVEEKDGVYNLEFKVSGIKKTFTIQLTKHEIEQPHPEEPKSGLESKIDKLEKNYKDLYNKYEELKVIRKNEIKDIVKEVFDKDIKVKLFEEIKQMFSSPSKSNSSSENKSENKNIESNIINKVNEIVNNKEDKINNQINIIQQQLNDNINYINNIKSNNNNYIILQVKIDEKHLNEDIRLFNQSRTYKYCCNFERDDIETIIDNQIVNIKYKNTYIDFKYDEKSKNCELSQKLEYNLKIEYSFYWNFTTTGIHTIKIIFKKKLLQCNYLFNKCIFFYNFILNIYNLIINKSFDIIPLEIAKNIYMYLLD